MYLHAFVAGLAILQTASACGVPELHDRAAELKKTTITNVHVWNGCEFPSTTSTVVLVGGIISNANPYGATVVDGAGGFLMPGLIDSHVHVTDCSYLTALRQYGVTIALDVGTYPYASVSICEGSGVTAIQGSGAAGTANGSKISLIPGFPTNSFIATPAAGKAFVAARVAEGVDYIKLFLDPLGPDDTTIAAVVKAAHAANKLVISHATTYAAYAQAARTGIDIVTHAPVDKALDSAIVPTLIMMQSTVNNTGAPFVLYTSNVAGSTNAAFDAGVAIAVGTDSNTNPYVPANPPFGDSLHEELALLVAAGHEPAQALAAATSVAANTFRLYDRGTIKAGLRADLVLLIADPTVDINNSRSIVKVWAEGVSV